MVEVLDRPVVPRRAVELNHSLAATPFEDSPKEQQRVQIRPACGDLDMDDLESIDVDSDLNVDFAVLDEQFGLVDGDGVVMVGIWLEQGCESMIPVMDGHVRLVDERGDLPVGLAGVVQEWPEDALLNGRSLAVKICCLRVCSTMWSSIADHPQQTSSATSFALFLTSPSARHGNSV